MRFRRWLVVTTILLAPAGASAQSQPWRASAHLASVGVRGSSVTLPGSDWSLNLDTGGGFGLAAARRLSPTWELELSMLRAGVDVSGDSQTFGTLDAGSVELTTVALVLQHRFFTTGRVQPYFGLGVHHGTLSGFDPTSALAASGVASLSFSSYTSVAAQLGAGIALGERTSLDFRATFFDMATEVTLMLPDGENLAGTSFAVDPWAIAAGIDFRF